MGLYGYLCCCLSRSLLCFVLLEALRVAICRGDEFCFVSTIWRTDDDKSLQQTEEEGFYMMDEQNFF